MEDLVAEKKEKKATTGQKKGCGTKKTAEKKTTKK